MRKLILVLLLAFVVSGCQSLKSTHFEQPGKTRYEVGFDFGFYQAMCEDLSGDTSVDCCVQRIMLKKGYTYIDPDHPNMCEGEKVAEKQ